jgi:sigma-B regulation protein RsbU (phosphoserine phosphatase)
MADSPLSPQAGATSPLSRQTAERLALLYELSQAFNSSLDLDEVLNRVIDEVIVALRAERGFVMLFDDNGQLSFRVARGMDQHIIHDPVFQVSLSVVEGVARQGQPVLTGDAQLDPRFNMRQSVRLLGLRSILCVPLRYRERILGTIYVDNRIQAGLFGQADLDLLNAIAYSAATAIENARLYRVAVEKGRLEREIQMARQVQASLLPTQVPQIPGWEFVARWLPARQVAGDYYDFIEAADGNLGMVVADVSDKGMPAALFMALTRSFVRASVDASLPPRDGMLRANRLICADSESGMFVTLFYALLEAERNALTYINAGHNPPLYFQMGKRPGQGALSRLGRTGMALGVDDGAVYDQRTLALNPGDFVVMYTDGVTDAFNPQGESFGMDRLESLILANRDRSAAEIVDAVERAVQNFTAAAPLFDDITLLVARRIP